jgi:hypothetical protein
MMPLMLGLLATAAPLNGTRVNGLSARVCSMRRFVEGPIVFPLLIENERAVVKSGQIVGLQTGRLVVVGQGMS